MNVRLLAIATILFLVISGCGYNPARDKDCPGCDLNGANLSKVFLVETNLTEANLTGANLTGANLDGANLDGVIGADFSSALNVPDKYLKD